MTTSTPQLRDFYRLLGMDPTAFDTDVIRQTNRTARRAFAVVFDLERSHFLALRDRLVSLHRSIREQERQGGGPVRSLRLLGLQLRFAAVVLRQMMQPMVASGEAP
jgi:magnesium-protoporphyrin IX monomethyl ester (oxidative) cyclase